VSKFDSATGGAGIKSCPFVFRRSMATDDSRWKKSTGAKVARLAGSGLSQMSRDEMESARQPIAAVKYRKGGKVRITKKRSKSRY
jgi:hypothetical protein